MFTISVKQLFSSTAKGSLSKFIPILNPENFMLFKKAAYNALSLQINTSFDFQLGT